MQKQIHAAVAILSGCLKNQRLFPQIAAPSCTLPASKQAKLLLESEPKKKSLWAPCIFLIYKHYNTDKIRLLLFCSITA